MPQVIIKYEKPETLKLLKTLAKYLHFDVVKYKKDLIKINGVSIIPGDPTIDTSDLKEIFSRNATDRLNDILTPGDPSIDISDMKDIFSGRNIDAKKLRKDAWGLKKAKNPS